MNIKIIISYNIIMIICLYIIYRASYDYINHYIYNSATKENVNAIVSALVLICTGVYMLRSIIYYS